MNIVGIPGSRVSIQLPVSVTLDGFIFEDVKFICRPLSYEELNRIFGINTSGNLQDLTIEEEVFDLVCEGVVGLDGMPSKDDLEGGVISTIVSGIISYSMSYINNIEDAVAKEEASLSVIDSMMAVISRYGSISISEVEKMPINKVFKLFASFKIAFPQEINMKDESSD